ncbi:ATP-binding protein [Pseudooceanicola onchidii]|uniref:ATP-binding protein n=1 Tax=Pseudooceanicola onchidii TaxID=2562279 RepID=UPI00145B0689|nr:ATP-binding protein [Pseudooceanicola onchidii]
MAVLVLAVANLLLGWGLGLTLLVRGGDAMAAMVPVTGACFLALALGQILIVAAPAAGGTARALAIAAPVLAWVNQVIFMLNLSPDAPGDRMSIATAVFVTLIGAAQIMDLSRRLPLVLLLTAIAVSLGGVVAFLFDVQELEQYSLFRGLSIHTSWAVFLLALSGLLLHHEVPAVEVLFSSNPEGRMARRFMAPALLVPIGLTLAGDHMTDMGWIGPKARLALLAVALTAVTLSLVLSVALYQKRLGQQENRVLKMLELILEGLDTGVVVLGEDGAAVLTNPRLHDLIGDQSASTWLKTADFRGLESGAELTGNAHPVRRAQWGEGAVMAAWRRPDGKELVLQFMAFDAGLDALGSGRRVISVNDMTDAWTLRATMAQTERMNAVAQLASGVAHEVTNIFGIIKLAVGTAELIAPTSTPDQYATILNACRRGGDLAERLQRLSVTSSGLRRTFDIVAAVIAATDLAERGLPRGVVLARDLPEEEIAVTCDPTDIEMALLNLVLNARNAIVEGAGRGAIAVRVRRVGQEVTLSVSDDGPGFDPALIEHLKEPQVTTRGAVGGTGFGLALIDSFARETGGRLELSIGDGGGAVAQLTLPVARNTSPQELPPRPTPVDLTGIQILIVEGHETLKGMLRASLTTLNALATDAADAEDALNLLENKGRFDVLITALRIEGEMDGVVLAKTAQARHPGLEVIFVTSDRAVGDASDLPGPVLHKPVNLGLLSQTVSGLARADQDRS